MKGAIKISLVLATVLALIVATAAFSMSAQAAPKKCNNGLDDDNDDLVDYPADAGCSSSGDNTEASSILVCDNGFDATNDADALADFRLSGGDPGCTSATDTSEVDGQCDDMADNDGDGKVDFGTAGTDSKCTSFSDSDESPRDFCTDSDGNNRFVQGTASGEDSSIPFSLTDFCLDAVTVREHLCTGLSGDYDPATTDLNCVTANSTTCVNGACV